jgi:hypothetical protein
VDESSKMAIVRFIECARGASYDSNT